MFFIILVLIILFIVFMFKKRKKLKLNNLVVINGGVKSGKTTLGVYLAIKQHKKELLKYRIDKFLLKKRELPLLYSNIPLKYKYYVPLSTDVLLRKKRLAYRSVCLLSEASLVANAQEFRNDEVNEGLMGFCKLYAHMTKGGYCFIETQTMSDLHHQFKKNINNYLYIYNCNKLIPFFMKFEVREMLYNYDNSNISNNFNDDIEKSMLYLWVSKLAWKRFDRYCYSVFTDDLPFDCCVLTNEEVKKLDLKARNVISFNKYKYLGINGGVDNANEKK